MTLAQFYLLLDQIPRVSKLISPLSDGDSTSTAAMSGAGSTSSGNMIDVTKVAKAKALAEAKGFM